MTRIEPVAVAAFTAVSACGFGRRPLAEAVRTNRSALRPLALFKVPFTTYVGEIEGSLPQVSAALDVYQCRNAAVALAALDVAKDGMRQAIEAMKTRYRAERIGIIIGTSTSGLYETESAYGYLLEKGDMPADFNFLTRHAFQATPRFLQRELDLKGPCYAVSTACSSSAKALAVAQRLIVSGVCDAVLSGGVDTLCRLTLSGFKSLDLLSEQRCRPLDKDRNGINIGEAAALLLIEKSCDENRHLPRLLAVGESSDGHHMSAPHPDGLGAVLAMRQALALAELTPAQLGYLNLHATATTINDKIESSAVRQVFGTMVPCSGTKGITGHTLGAAGALETIIALLAVTEKFIPGTAGLKVPDDDIGFDLIKEPIPAPRLDMAMSNSFGFGGNNASVIVAAGYA
jgi:3-oxoacyl-[acyl-carrier-protein] synthase-1